MARRLQDISEQSRTTRALILLDWDKAFDKIISQPKMTYRLIKPFYISPQFKVQSGDKKSEWRFQNSGIRQGCPSSPYLYVQVTGTLFADIKREFCTPRQFQPMGSINFSEIFFADDMLIFGANIQCINKMLHAIERRSAYYGRNLNYGKCVNLTPNQRISSVCSSPAVPAAGRLVPRQRVSHILRYIVDGHVRQ